MKYRNRSIVARLVNSQLSIFILLIILIFILRGMYGIRGKVIDSNDRLLAGEKSLENLQVHESELQGKVAYLSTDQGVEDEIRSKFQVASHGESVAVIIDESISTTSDTSVNKNISLSWWQKVLRMIGI